MAESMADRIAKRLAESASKKATSNANGLDNSVRVTPVESLKNSSKSGF